MSEQSHHKEGIQRIKIGLAGLTGVLLLIGLANIVVDNVRRDDVAEANLDPAANGAASQAVVQLPAEPLAELGVAPTPETAADTPVVADLQPDPNLKQPMDRPPLVPALPNTQRPASKPAQ